jgi:hypothetical protein
MHARVRTAAVGGLRVTSRARLPTPNPLAGLAAAQAEVPDSIIFVGI